MSVPDQSLPEPSCEPTSQLFDPSEALVPSLPPDPPTEQQPGSSPDSPPIQPTGSPTDDLAYRPAATRGVLTHVRELTRARAKLFLEALAQTGNVTEACRQSGISPRTVQRCKKRDPGFAELWEEALLISAGLLEAEARRRAFDGVLKPVYQKGMQVGVVREYSDKLMELLLKATNPDRFKDRKEVAHTGAVVHFNITGVDRPGADATKAQPIEVEADELPANGESHTDTETA